MALRRTSKGSSKTLMWLMATAAYLAVVTELVSAAGSSSAAGPSPSAGSSTSASCPPCDQAETILQPCNSTLGINNWPGVFVYQPTQAQAQCACNDNFYQQISACVTCQSSSSAHLSVKALADYKLVCQSLGQTAFPPVYIPGQATSTSTGSAPTDTSLPTAGPNSGNTGTQHSSSSLSSGAIAGIIVSAIALIVALSVAGYVFGRRRRDQIKQKEEDDLYKYQETTSNSYMDTPLPQYTGMIQSSLPSLPQLTNLRVMNPDNDDEDENLGGARFPNGNSMDAPRTSSPGWRRGSFDDD